MTKKVEPVKEQAKKAAPAKSAGSEKAAPKKAAPAAKSAPAKEKVVEKAVAAKSQPKKAEPAKEAKAEKTVKPVAETVAPAPQSTKEEIRGTLIKRREDLMKEIVGSRERESDSLKKDIGDIYDEASSERERELSLTLGDRDRQKLIEIDEALQRLENGEYGVCESCGENIAPGRLKAQPFARLCIACKSEEERQEARQKKFEAEGVYRTVNYAEEEEG